jgi:hypothetical protein
MSISKQTLIPVIRVSRKQVLGGYVTGGFINFTGSETTFALPGSGHTIPIVQWFPDNVRNGKRKWFMAYLVDEDNFRLRGYTAHNDFVSSSEMNPVTTFRSPSSMPGIVYNTPGTLADLMNSPNIDVLAVSSATPNPVTGLTATHGVVYGPQNISTISGGVPASVSVTSGALPAGMVLSISGQNVVLSGTPTTAGAISFTATVITDHGNVVIPVSGTIA